MFFVLAIKDGDSYPSVHTIFSSEEKAIEYAKSYKFQSTAYGEESITHQYDIDNKQSLRLFMHDPLQLGMAEEGGLIVYYRGLTNEKRLKYADELSEKEILSVRPI